MTVERLTVSVESEFANRGLVATWEREHGTFSDEELAAARALIDG